MLAVSGGIRSPEMNGGEAWGKFVMATPVKNLWVGARKESQVSYRIFENFYSIQIKGLPRSTLSMCSYELPCVPQVGARHPWAKPEEGIP